MRKIKKMVCYIFLAAIVTILAFPIGGFSNIRKANAEMSQLFTAENGGNVISSPSMPVFNGITYNGIGLNGLDNSTFYYNDDIDISDNDTLTPLIEFLVTPEEMGVEEMNMIVISLADKSNPDNGFRTEIIKRSEGGTMMANALATNQTYIAGESFTDGTLTTSGTAANIGMTFSGNVATSASYFNEKMEQVTQEENLPVCLYYHKAENALYTNFGRQYGANPTMVNFGTEQEPFWRWRIRQLGKAYDGNSDPAWEGFEDDYVTLSITMKKLVANDANMTVLSIDGKELFTPLQDQKVSDGIEGLAYKIPAPLTYDNALKEFVDFKQGGKVSVSIGEFDILDHESYDEGLEFIPNQAGNYIVTYHYGQDSLETTLKIHDEETAPELILNVPNIAGTYFPGYKIKVGGNAKTELYNNPQDTADLTLNIKQGTEVVVSYDKEDLLNNSVEYTFGTELGDYIFIYEATDYLGRTRTVEYTAECIRNTIELNSGIASKCLVIDTDDIVISEEDIQTYDYAAGYITSNNSLVDEYNLSIFVSEDSESYQPYDDNFVFDIGTYDIKYLISYRIEEEDHVIEITRQIIVAKDILSLELIGEIGGAKQYVPNNAISDIIYLKAQKDSELKVPMAGAIIDEEMITVPDMTVTMINPNNEMSDVTSQFVDNVLQFNVSINGTYYLQYKASWDEDFISTLTLIIEVKPLWLDIKTPLSELPEIVTIGSEIDFGEYKVIDYHGNVIDDIDFTIAIDYMGNEIILEGTVFSPELEGDYVIRIFAENDQETTPITTLEFRAEGGQKPIIELLSNIVNTAYVGDSVKVPLAKAYTSVELDIAVSIKVLLNEEEVMLFNNEFKTTTEGTYKIIYTAVDKYGLTSNYIHEITVKSKSYIGIIIGSIAGGLVLVGLVVFGIIFYKKKVTKRGK